MNENGTSQMQNNTRGEKGAEEKKMWKWVYGSFSFSQVHLNK